MVYQAYNSYNILSSAWGQNFKIISLDPELEDGYFNLFTVTSLMIMNLVLTVLYLV